MPVQPAFLQSIEVTVFGLFKHCVEADILNNRKPAPVQKQKHQQPAYPAVAMAEWLDTHKVKNELHNQDKRRHGFLLHRTIVSIAQVCDRLLCVSGRRRHKQDTLLSRRIRRLNHIINTFETAFPIGRKVMIQICMQFKNVIGCDRNIVITREHLLEAQAVSENLFFRLAMRRNLPVNKSYQSFVGRGNPFDTVGRSSASMLCLLSKIFKDARFLTIQERLLLLVWQDHGQVHSDITGY